MEVPRITSNHQGHSTRPEVDLDARTIPLVEPPSHANGEINSFIATREGLPLRELRTLVNRKESGHFTTSAERPGRYGNPLRPQISVDLFHQCLELCLGGWSRLDRQPAGATIGEQRAAERAVDTSLITLRKSVHHEARPYGA
jgi:hypothetical protein